MRLLSPQLQAFLAVARHGTVHAAAEVLHITQTGITQRIKALEKRMHASLFIRSRQGMKITPEGEVLLRYCASFELLEEEAMASIAPTGKPGVLLTISGPMTIMRTRIIPGCIPVMRHYSHLQMQFDIEDDETRLDKLQRGECQFAIIEEHLIQDGLSYKKLKPEQYVLVVPYDWRNKKLETIISSERIIDFDSQDKLTFSYLSKFKLFEMSIKDRHYTNRVETLADMITENVGYGILPLEVAKPYVDNKKLAILNQGKIYHHQLFLAWYPRAQVPPYFAAIIDACY